MDAQKWGCTFNLPLVRQISITSGTKYHTIDNGPISSAKAYHAEAMFYEVKGKEKVNDEDVQSHKSYQTSTSKICSTSDLIRMQND